MKVIALLPLAGALLLQQGSSAGSVRIWNSTEIHSRGEALAKKMDANKLASEVVAKEGNTSFTVAHREASGQAEIHDTEADIMIISEGTITMVYGGTVVDGKTTAPGQTRGAAITGGTEVTIGPGGILHIPARVPHQMKLAPGAKVTYFVAKVTP